jgi:hypothetical protein
MHASSILPAWRWPIALPVLLLAAGCPSPPREALCNDGIDNDSDGRTDCDDPNCVPDPACALPDEDAGSDEDAGPDDGGPDDGGPGDGAPGDAGDPGPLDEDPAGDLDPVAGHPALDIVGTGIRRSPGGGDLFWFRAVFADRWRPPATIFSWYAQVTFESPGMANIIFTTQHHDGEDLTFTEGIPETAATYVDEPNGFRVQVELRDGFVPESYTVESAVLLTMGGTLVRDMAGRFDATGAPTEPFPPP